MPFIEGNVSSQTRHRNGLGQLSAVHQAFSVPIKMSKHSSQHLDFRSFYFTSVLFKQVLEFINIYFHFELLQVAYGILRSYFVLKRLQTYCASVQKKSRAQSVKGSCNIRIFNSGGVASLEFVKSEF